MENILDKYWAGLYTKEEALAALDQIQIRGQLRPDNSFIGYDYANQFWVEWKQGTTPGFIGDLATDSLI